MYSEYYSLSTAFEASECVLYCTYTALSTRKVQNMHLKSILYVYSSTQEYIHISLSVIAFVLTWWRL